MAIMSLALLIDLTLLVVIALGVALVSMFGHRRRHERRRRIPLAIVIAGCLALPGCLCDDAELVADDQPVQEPCLRGLANAALWSERPMDEVVNLCESVGEGETCVAVCAVYGLGLVCDREGCETQEQW